MKNQESGDIYIGCEMKCGFTVRARVLNARSERASTKSPNTSTWGRQLVPSDSRGWFPIARVWREVTRIVVKSCYSIHSSRCRAISRPCALNTFTLGYTSSVRQYSKLTQTIATILCQFQSAIQRQPPTSQMYVTDRKQPTHTMGIPILRNSLSIEFFVSHLNAFVP